MAILESELNQAELKAELNDLKSKSLGENNSEIVQENNSEIVQENSSEIVQENNNVFACELCPYPNDRKWNLEHNRYNIFFDSTTF